ncbi:MAG: hypothetical protein J3K34DRAFT_462769 [Monoraphidium minutum]|nr:MAG: hypothetical protein J3K34DRAFT_462769 [Monoraphidium minutum]
MEFVTGAPGSVGDAALWNECSFNRCIKVIPDGGDADKRRFNTRITNLRRGSEMAFARYSGRWKIVKWNHINDPTFATLVSKAAAALHNICQDRDTRYSDGWQDETDPRRIQLVQQRAAAMRAEQQRRRTAAARPVVNTGSLTTRNEGEKGGCVGYAGGARGARARAWRFWGAARAWARGKREGVSVETAARGRRPTPLAPAGALSAGCCAGAARARARARVRGGSELECAGGLGGRAATRRG